MKISVSLDPLIELIPDNGSTSHFLHQAATLTGISGPDAMAFSIHDRVLDRFGQETITALRKSIPCTAMMFVPADEKYIKPAVTTLPDLVIVTDDYGKTSRRLLPFSTINKDSINDILLNLEANDIPSGLFIEPESDLLKDVRKLPVDWICLDVTALSEPIDRNEEALVLEKINNVTLMAHKLGIGVSVMGNIGREQIKTFTTMPEIDEMVLGMEFWTMALLKGIDPAGQMFSSFFNR